MLTQAAADSLSLGVGDQATLSGSDGSADVTVVITSADPLNRVVTTADVDRISGDDAWTDIWAKISGAVPASCRRAASR